MRYESTHKENTRASILQQAGVQLLLKGPSGIRIADLMAQTGLTHGGFYAHFASKEVLIAAAIEQKFEDSRAFLKRCMAGRDTADGLRRYIDAYLSATHRDASGTGCPMPRLMAEMSLLSDAARTSVTRGMAKLNVMMSGYLRRLGHPHASDLARFVTAELVGTLCVARAWGVNKKSDVILRRSRASVKQRLGL
jgi:TetR/AcrR family transcriptional regulator, transcriptional repressor for nem operon